MKCFEILGGDAIPGLPVVYPEFGRPFVAIWPRVYQDFRDADYDCYLPLGDGLIDGSNPARILEAELEMRDGQLWLEPSSTEGVIVKKHAYTEWLPSTILRRRIDQYARVDIAFSSERARTSAIRRRRVALYPGGCYVETLVIADFAAGEGVSLKGFVQRKKANTGFSLLHPSRPTEYEARVVLDDSVVVPADLAIQHSALCASGAFL